MSERQAERLSLLPEIGGRFGGWFEAPHYMARRGWGGCRRMDVSFLFSLRQRNKIVKVSFSAPEQSISKTVA